MITKIIELSIRNRVVVITCVAAMSLWGLYCLYHTPVDAIPDLSENQVIVWADWSGRSPKEVEDQITYPLSVNLQGLAGVKTIRAASEFGFSMVTLIFDDSIEYYFARQRVLEKLSTAANFLPAGVVPYLASDASALGQVFSYTVEGEGKSLDELRAIQDWYVRYQLYVPGVAEVASVGGFIREYQVDVDPDKLRAFDISLGQVYGAIEASNSSVGGKVIQKGGAEYLVRGLGWITHLDDIRNAVVTERNGVPITVERLGTVQLGPAFRRGALEKNGSEAVGGIVILRQGENPLAVIERVKEKLRNVQDGLPAGTRIVPFYDRTGLILASIGTLERTLLEEMVIASLVVFIVLWHIRSALAICITLPLAVLISFIFMYYLNVPSNIMSLSGIAISIGVLVDAGIVMTENAYNRLQEHFGDRKVEGDTRDLIASACKVVGGPLFFSIVIMLLSFAPVFVLGGMEGRMFNPLAYTKSFALGGVALLAITLVPALLPTLLRGRLRSQQQVWIVRSFVNIYKPMLEFFIRCPDVIVVITGTFLLVGLPVFPRKVPWIFFTVGAPFIIGLTTLLVARHKMVCFAILLAAAVASFQLIHPLGEEFMPALDELSLLDMPITRPNVNLTQATDDLKERDAVLRGFPEVRQVVGKIGRADTPTDPAPIDMVETVISFLPKELWPHRGVALEAVQSEARAVLSDLTQRGVAKSIPADDGGSVAEAVAMASLVQFDRILRGICVERQQENVEPRTRELAIEMRRQLLPLVTSSGAEKAALPESAWDAQDRKISQMYGARFNEEILLEDVTSAVEETLAFLRKNGALVEGADALAARPGLFAKALDTVLATAGKKTATPYQRVRNALLQKDRKLRAGFARQLDAELRKLAPPLLAGVVVEEALREVRGRQLLGREPAADEAPQASAAREKILKGTLLLERKSKVGVKDEMNSDLQVPGWSNIWTQPIINRVDMLSTGVRTQIGVKIFGSNLEELQAVSNQIAAVLKGVRGAVDVNADQIVGENYLEVAVRREQAARYGVSAKAIQDVIEVALGGREITMTVEGRQRFPVRVRYPRDWREDEESVGRLLVPTAVYSAAEGGSSPDVSSGASRGQEMSSTAGETGAGAGGMGGMASQGGSAEAGSGVLAAGLPSSAGSSPGAGPSTRPRLRQVPLSLVADVRIVPGPSMIKSENGLLRTFVSLNVKDRDIVGFVSEAERAVQPVVEGKQGYYVEWSGQFEHQIRAQRTLSIVLPAVILIIFLILFATYRDFPDTLLMFLAVPGAVAGGAIFQFLLPKLGLDISGNFSVAVWVGYIACFGLATETSIVMLVYLREAIERRGGMDRISSPEEIREAVVEGAVHRLRPKLLTEGTTILALIPMLWATGVGAEYMRPMAVPILGGILVADEVIDVLIPVLFYWERCRRLRKRLETQEAV